MRKLGTAQKDVVLIGAGNSHLQCVRMYAMKGPPDLRLTLISDFAIMPYSGMIPGVLSGQYRREEAEIDLIRLCARAGVRFIQGKVSTLNRNEQRICVEGRPNVYYDRLSINVGSHPTIAGEWQDNYLSVKPLGNILDRLEALDGKDHFSLLIVGAGASGIELAFALKKRFGARVRLEMSVAGDRILKGFASSVAKKTFKALEDAQIQVHLEQKITRPVPQFDVVLWATQASPLPWVKNLDLEKDENGFLKVHTNLQSVTDPRIYGSGDCISLENNPNLPKAGIFAVREGPYLYKNLIEEKQTSYRPQPIYLFLLNTGDGGAIMSYGPLAASGKWAFRWKDHIDRKWVRTFKDLYEAPALGNPQRCGGCGSKTPAAVLYSALNRVSLPTRKEMLLAPGEIEDTSLHRVPGSDLVELQSIEFFKSFITDSYLLGKIAATNALSDLYSKNAEPFCGLVIAGIPLAARALQEEDLSQLLAGVSEVFKEHGVALAGGHTSESTNLSIGLCVTGYGKENSLFRKKALQSDDELVLTKPLGTGALLAAWMDGQLSATNFQIMVQSMLLSNAKAAQVFAKYGVRACTDITGFGLAGHLLEMLEGLNLTAHLSDIPTLPGVQPNIWSTLHSANKAVLDKVKGNPPEIIFDPQTSGGLLAGVPKDKVELVLAEIPGYRIGRISEGVSRIVFE